MRNRKSTLTIADLVAALRELPQDAVIEEANWSYVHKRCRYNGSLETRDDDKDSDDRL